MSIIGPLFFGGLCAGTFGLGSWQSSRYFEKIEKIEAQEAEIAELLAELAKPSPVVNTSTAAASRQATADSLSFHRLTGTFDHSRAMLLGPRGPPPGAISEDGPNSGRSGGGLASSPQGYWVITPLKTTEGEVLVMRGWEPIDGRRKQQRNGRDGRDYSLPITGTHPCPTGEVTVATIRVKAENGGMFAPPPISPNTATPTLLWLSQKGMADLARMEEERTTVLFKEVRSPDKERTRQLLQPSLEAAVEFKVTPETHVGYAATWFSLSAAGVVMTRKLLKSVPK